MSLLLAMECEKVNLISLLEDDPIAQLVPIATAKRAKKNISETNQTIEFSILHFVLPFAAQHLTYCSLGDVSSMSLLVDILINETFFCFSVTVYPVLCGRDTHNSNFHSTCFRVSGKPIFLPNFPHLAQFSALGLK